VKVFCFQNKDNVGFLLQVSNERLTAIGQHRLFVRAAESFDCSHQAYREGRFNQFSETAGVIEACCNGPGMWLIRKQTGAENLRIGNDDQHPLLWPESDKGRTQRWRLSVEGQASTAPRSGTPSVPLVPVKLTLVVNWTPEKNEMLIEQGIPVTA
jgi:hypothetical protein